MNANETLYLRDDEIDEFGDNSAYGESLEEDFEEEEEEEEAELPGVTGSEGRKRNAQTCTTGHGRWRWGWLVQTRSQTAGSKKGRAKKDG